MQADCHTNCSRLPANFRPDLCRLFLTVWQHMMHSQSPRIAYMYQFRAEPDIDLLIGGNDSNSDVQRLYARTACAYHCYLTDY